MPFTVITLKNAPPSLRGDLSKWMQEIATGVYVGNFNTRVREQLWERVIASVGKGEATLSYTYRNEIGYRFETINAQRKVIDNEGIPLVLLPNPELQENETPMFGYSNAAKQRKMKKYAHRRYSDASSLRPYVVIDIETDGLDVGRNQIIEIGAVRYSIDGAEEFHSLIQTECELPGDIVKLTGITQEMIEGEGRPLKEVLVTFLDFVGDAELVGYGIPFDLKFLNHALSHEKLPGLMNPAYDLMRYVKSEKVFLDNYQLQTVLLAYGMDARVPHRALLDARLIGELATKVNKFVCRMKRD